MLVPYFGMRAAASLLILPTLTACAAPMRDLAPHLKGWVGVEEVALAARIGPPTDQATLSNGDQILTWKSDGSANACFTCTLQFRINPQGRITWARATGNPDTCWKVLTRSTDYAGADGIATHVE